MDPLAIETAEALLEAFDDACIAARGDGAVLAANSAARSLLNLTPDASLQTMLSASDSVAGTLQRAMRSSGTTPVTFMHDDGAPLRGRLTPIRLRSRGRPDAVLVRLERRSDANARLIRLRERIDRANRERRRLRADNARLRHEVERVMPQLVEMSFTDALTGLANRRFFDREFEREWRRAGRSGEPLSLLIVDVDHFKHYNDHYGHVAGDDCLQEISRALDEAAVRTSDRVCRVGGEEFAVLAPATDADGASVLAERLLRAVRTAALGHAAVPSGRVTVSIGYGAARPAAGDCGPEFYAAVDRALYRAKSAGRNGKSEARWHTPIRAATPAAAS